jgi:hypothetical protein
MGSAARPIRMTHAPRQGNRNRQLAPEMPRIELEKRDVAIRILPRRARFRKIARRGSGNSNGQSVGPVGEDRADSAACHPRRVGYDRLPFFLERRPFRWDAHSDCGAAPRRVVWSLPRSFWQRGGGYDRNLTEPRTIWAEIASIHANPVRRGLCESATDWPWSSARELNQRPRFCGAASWRICGAGVPPARAAETAAPQTGRPSQNRGR